MLNSYYTEKILGIQEAEVKNIEENEKNIVYHLEMKRKPHKCPNCGALTDKVHDYRKQNIQEESAFGKKVIIALKKRRYACSCGKKFIEEIPFLGKYQRRTQRVMGCILEKLSSVHSYSSVANEYDVSINTVIRIFKNISYPHPEKLPEALGIDEFKGNSGKQKYHCILTDLSNGRVIDILHTRYQHDLIDYFKKYDRSKVKYFVSDMYSTYSEIAKTYFPKATYIIDKYHWIRQATWAFENVRKEIQKKFSKSHRIYFKHSRKLLLKHWDKLSDDDKRQVLIMLDASPTLSTAYHLKEQLYLVLDEKDLQKKNTLFNEWIQEASESEISPFVKCANTYLHWKTPILNSFASSYTNGFTEGCNNKIKVLKRNAYGLRDFNRFRNRILFLFSNSKI